MRLRELLCSEPSVVTETSLLCPECGAEVVREQELSYPYFRFYDCPQCAYRHNSEGFNNQGPDKYPPKKPAWMIEREATCSECGRRICPKCHHAEALEEVEIGE